MLKTNQSILLSSLLLSSVLFADMSESQELYDDANCIKCHTDKSFVHKEDKVNNFKKLLRSVNACAINTKAQWFDDEIHNVAKYLNKKHYKYKVTSIEEE